MGGKLGAWADFHHLWAWGIVVLAAASQASIRLEFMTVERQRALVTADKHTGAEMVMELVIGDNPVHASFR